MMKKRGQEGISSVSWIGGAIILIIIVVLVIIFQSNLFGSIGTATEILTPEEIGLISAKCVLAAKNPTLGYTEFCSFDEYGDPTQYVNCEHSLVHAALIQAQTEEQFTIIECPGELEKEKCEELSRRTDYKPETLINNRECSYWLNAGTTTTPPTNDTESGSTTGSTESGSNEEPEPMALDQ